MAAWTFNWHTTVLTHYFLDRQADPTCKDVIKALFEALADQRETLLSGSSSATGLLHRQRFDTSSLEAWSTLHYRLVPLPFRGRDIFDGEVLPKAAEVDKEESQMEKARLSASRKGCRPRSSSRGQSRTRSRSNLRPPAQNPSTQRGNTVLVATLKQNRPRSRFHHHRILNRGCSASRHGRQGSVSFKEPPSTR